MNSENINIWCWLIPIIAGLVCAILGYLLGRLSSGSKHDDCNNRISKLQADLKACRDARAKLESDLKQAKSVATAPVKTLTSNLGDQGITSSFAAATASVVAFDADAAKAVFGKKIKQDDLTIVEGIGPKIQELFHNHSVKTWKALSECSIGKCQEVLDSGGSRYRIHNPKTWPDQAKLAYEGKWQELLDLQDRLSGGV